MFTSIKTLVISKIRSHEIAHNYLCVQDDLNGNPNRWTDSVFPTVKYIRTGNPLALRAISALSVVALLPVSAILYVGHRVLWNAVDYVMARDYINPPPRGNLLPVAEGSAVMTPTEAGDLCGVILEGTLEEKREIRRKVALAFLATQPFFISSSKEQQAASITAFIKTADRLTTRLARAEAIILELDARLVRDKLLTNTESTHE